MTTTIFRPQIYMAQGYNMKILVCGVLSVAMMGLVASAHATGAPSEFGPLSFAASHIIPSGYSLSYAPGVDNGVSVAWREGADWRNVLRDALAQRHLTFTESGQWVRILNSDSAYDGGGAVLNTQNQVVPNPVPTPYSYDPGRGVMFMPYHSVEAAPIVSNFTRHPTNVVVAAPSPSYPVLAQTVPPVKQNEIPMAPVAKPPPVLVKPVVGNPTPIVPVSAPSAIVADSRPPMSARERRLATHDAAIATSQMKAEPAAIGNIHVWHARQGQTLDQVLQDWCELTGKINGWTLVFQSKMIYELQAGADFNGDFMQAVETLIKSVRASPRPYADFYTRNKVLIVRNQVEQIN
jgi:Toxin co-regulated pilus biosynthesis protein Q